MKVLVTGGRNFKNRHLVNGVLDLLDPTIVVCGGCSGADDLAVAWCKTRGRIAHVHFADWKRYGRAAGPTRNIRMIVTDEPDVVLAFPGGKGTRHMVMEAHAGGFPIIKF